QYPQALADYSKAIELDPKFALAYFERARTHYMLGQYQQAIADLKTAAELFHQQGNIEQYNKAMSILKELGQ
ncbi:MAG: tetratricopeptide repeat protein, partial [Cyanobacteriota bacterium ELA615]